MRGIEQAATAFREEAAERIAELEAALLELERNPSDGELVHRAFRALHTVKGSGAMFGFDELAALAHELETVLDGVRGGRVPVTADLVALGLRAKDQVRAMLEGTASMTSPETGALVDALRSLAPREGLRSPPGPAPRAAGQGTPRSWLVRFAPRPDLLRDGTNPLALLDELRALGPCDVRANAGEVPPLEILAPEDCHLRWEARVTTDRGADAIRDVFIFVEDRCELGIEPAEPGPRVPSAPRPTTPAGVLETSSVRVAAAKLDRLVDLVGEMVIAQARLSRLASRGDDPELSAVSEELERLSAELRDRTLDVRMVPIGTTFGRFRRVLHDLAAELGKEIDLVTEGADTELDKTVIERLTDPLVHLLRNACDHGIEAPEARRAAGKPVRGTVRLEAFQSGPNVVVELRDDGRGLDLAAIRAKAIERGLVDPGDSLSEREVVDLVFRPGFSTATAVSSVSGRGVGMDVVRRAVQGLRGTVNLETATGAGTTTRIVLPLTLAIIEGLLVEAGGTSFVLPLATVEECVELAGEAGARGRGARLAAVRGELVPYLRLRELFSLPGRPPELEQIAIVRTGGERCGLVVDVVAGQHQTVIKSLGRAYRDTPGIAGATVLGDGTVAFILDVAALTKGLAREASPFDPPGRRSHELVP